jgi:hypothetical protein
MKIFSELAKQVAQEWQKSGESLESFASIATDCLERLKYNWTLEELEAELRKWAVSGEPMPAQMNVHNAFGQPSITVFNNGRFVIDLYFWVDFDTSIHSHGFRGAFKVIHGESLQETFLAPITEKIADDLLLVDMAESKVEMLKEGSVRTIAPGTDLTHRVIHLAKPTVSLCVKTINEPEIKQWVYLPTGLAVQKQILPVDLIKQVYLYQYLYLLERQDATSFLSSVLNGLKTSQQIHLYEDAASGALELHDEVIDALTGAILARHEGTKWWSRYEANYLEQETPSEIRDRTLGKL